MKALILFLALSLSACSMSYEEVEQADAYCADKGLHTKREHSVVGAGVLRVKCVDDDGSEYVVEIK